MTMIHEHDIHYKTKSMELLLGRKLVAFLGFPAMIILAFTYGVRGDTLLLLPQG